LRKSSKRSAASTPRPHNAPTLYVDECLGRTLARSLLAEGYDAKPFDEFAGQPDVEFLPVIGARQWVLLTKDKDVRRNQLEVQAILNGRPRVRHYRRQPDSRAACAPCLGDDAEDHSDLPADRSLRLQHHGLRGRVRRPETCVEASRTGHKVNRASFKESPPIVRLVSVFARGH
jgi:hypothetical protein